jgi:lysophospholipase L1-like esterase
VLLTLPPIDSRRYLRFICRDGLSRENILRWLGDVDAIYRWQEKYSAMVGAIAAEEGLRVIDLRGCFLRDGHSPEELLCEDGIHPSRLGQSLIFRTLSAALG